MKKNQSVRQAEPEREKELECEAQVECDIEAECDIETERVAEAAAERECQSHAPAHAFEITCKRYWSIFLTFWFAGSKIQ